MSNTFTRLVAEFIVDTGYEHIPSVVVQRSRSFVYDGLGVALAGAKQTCTQLVWQLVAETQGRPEASLLGSHLKAPAPLAALANGVA
ncbi:MAG TPA: MmgE/PrpD family protein, partial [Limnochordales bacterium]